MVAGKVSFTCVECIENPCTEHLCITNCILIRMSKQLLFSASMGFVVSSQTFKSGPSQLSRGYDCPNCLDLTLAHATRARGLSIATISPARESSSANLVGKHTHQGVEPSGSRALL